MAVHNVAVVGCGSIALGCHLPNILANPRLKLVTVCDKDYELARKCQERFGAEKACNNWKDVLADEAVDLITLATHTNLRSELILPALEAGKAVYVEKPLANSLREMKEILRATRSSPRRLCVGHNRRSSPGVLELRRLLGKVLNGHSGTLPSIDRSNGGTRPSLPEERQIQMLVRINDDCRSWKDWVFSDSEGIAFAEMVHFVDLALWLNPSPPVRVFAEGSARGNFTFILHFEDGSLTTLQHSLVGHFDSPKELIEISAHHVSLVLDYCMELRQRGLTDEPFRRTFPLTFGREYTQLEGIAAFHDAVDNAKIHCRDSEPVLIFPDKGHYHHLNRFIDCMEGHGENPCDASGAVVTTAVSLKLLESLRRGVPLAVGPDDLNILSNKNGP